MRRFLWFAFGLLVLGAGVTLALVSRAEIPENYGWFAYTPLSDELPEGQRGWGDPDRPYVVSLGQLIGAGVGTLGLVILVSGAAYLLGRRRERVPDSP